MTTTTKQIRAALDAATPGPWELINTPERGQHIIGTHGVVISTNTGWKCYVDQNDVRVIANAPAWLAWCLEQIAARDALLRRFVDHYAGGHDDYCSGCHRNCAEARKILEESK